jgi:hypothetical protein
MEPSTPVALHLLPGRLVVTFLVRVGCAVSTVVVPPPDFMEGLRAATACLQFGEPCRWEPAAEDLLPWAGNV